MVRSRPTKVISVVSAKENVAVVLEVQWPYLGF